MLPGLTFQGYYDMKMQILLWLLAMATALPMASLAHDPLDDDPAHHHHDASGVDTLAVNTDLAAVRALVLAFRETGDDAHLDEAWELLGPVLERSTHDPELLIAAAFVAQSRHDFKYAEQLIDRAQSIRPDNDEGWLLLASIRLVHGDSQEAARACTRLRAAPPLVVLTCKARTALAAGNHDRAYLQLQRIVDITIPEGLPPDLLAWSYSVLGDLAVEAGDDDQAIDAYRRSLALAERTQVRAAYVDVLLQLEQFDEAWSVLDAGPPALPLLVRRLITAKALGRMAAWQSVLTRVDREFEAWIDRSDWLHAREMTRFYIDVIDRPSLARRLALINLRLQREPEDLRLEQRTRLHEPV